MHSTERSDEHVIVSALCFFFCVLFSLCRQILFSIYICVYNDNHIKIKFETSSDVIPPRYCDVQSNVYKSSSSLKFVNCAI